MLKSDPPLCKQRIYEKPKNSNILVVRLKGKHRADVCVLQYTKRKTFQRPLTAPLLEIGDELGSLYSYDWDST